MKRLISAFLFSIFAVSAFGDTIYVDANGTGDYPTIQAAINAATNGDVIVLMPGTYKGSGNKNIKYFGKAITVRSTNPYEQSVVDSTIIDGEYSGIGFVFDSGEGPDSVLSGLTITLCDADSGSGILSTSSPTVSRCKFINNETIYDGGGIYNTGNMIIVDCAFISNGPMVAGIGGGIYNGGSIDVINCIFINNYGSALYNYYSGAVNITNCLFVGPLDNLGASQVNVSNCTFSNTVWGISSYSSTVNVNNCILWKFYFGAIDGTGLTVSYSCIEGDYPGTGNIDSDPLFVTGPRGDYYLSQITAGQAINSPCVDAGSDTAANLGMRFETTRTDEFIDNGIVDMGFHYPPNVGDPDLNADAFVDFIDYAIFADDWQQEADPCDPDDGDINKDGIVNIYDLVVLVEQWLICSVTRATNPEPPDNAADVSSNVVLKWSPGEKDVSHDVYFGTDFNEVNDADITNINVYMGNQDTNFWDTNNYNPSGLDINTMYCWRIDEIVSAGMAKGNVWRFTVPPLPGQAGNPIPADMTTDVGVIEDLSWTAGDFATSHDVYFGTTNPPPFKVNQTGTTYDPWVMNTNTTYYWRIDEKNYSGTTTGILWSFTTGSVSEVNNANLAAWWKFDDGTGTIAYDSAGDNIGALINGPTWTTGLIDGGLSFDGSDDYITVPDDSSLKFTRDDKFSLCVWLNPNSKTGHILSKMQTTGFVNMLDFTYEATWDSSYQRVHFNICIHHDYVYILTPTNSVPADSWSHAVFIYDSRYMRIYINGELKASGYFPYNTGSYPGEFSMGIGAWLLPSRPLYYFKGILDDLRIYNRALTAEEVVLLYQTIPPPGQASNPAPTDGTTDASISSDLGWSAGSSAMSHNVYFGTTNPPPFRGNQTGTTYDTGTLDINTTYYWRIDEKNPRGTTQGTVWSFTTSLPIPNHHWALDETSGTTAYDSAGSYNGTFNGGDPCWVDGLFSGAIDCNGVSDYFSIPGLNPGTDYNSTDTFSVSGWFKTSQSTGIQTIVGQWGQMSTPSCPNCPWTNSYYGWQVLVENNKVVARFGPPSGIPTNITGISDVNDGNWHNFTLVYPTKNSNATLYVDGNSEGTPGAELFTVGPTSSRIGDGSYGNAPLKGGPFCGMIDDVIIYNRALTADEVYQIYASGW